MRPRRRQLVQYLAAVCLTALAVAVRVAMEPLWGVAAPFVALYPAIMVSAWIGGPGPGLLATALAALAADYFWLEPYRALAVSTVADGTLLALFVVVSVGLVLL